jgi:hypothetical protein
MLILILIPQEWVEWGSSKNRFRKVPDGPSYGQAAPADTAYDINHGKVVAAVAAGQTGGIARKAEIVFVPVFLNTLPERTLEAFVKIANDVATKPRDTCVINMSWGMPLGYAISDTYFVIMMMLMWQMQDKYGCIFVAAPGNDGKKGVYFPSAAVKHIKGVFVVGAVDWKGKGYTDNTGLDIINVFAGGVDIQIFGQTETGTSFAAPQVAGLVAYFRSHPSWSTGKGPNEMFAGITKLARYVQYKGNNPSEYPVIWNGQTGLNQCAPLKRGLDSRQLGEGASCELPGSGSGPGGPQGPQGPRVEFRPGDPSPTCTANCGKLCSGFYCVPNPTGAPPDFSSNPASPGSPTSSGFSNSPGFPELTPGPTITRGPGEWCLSSTTVRECNGGPRGAPCITTTSCVSFGRPDLPDLTTTKPFSPSGGSCLSSTTWTERGGPQFEAIITKSSCASWSIPTPTPTTTAKPDPPPLPQRCFTAHFYIGTSPLGEDSAVLSVYENGVERWCNGVGGANQGISDKTVLKYECRGGGSATITEEGRNFVEYKAADGWTVKPNVRDYQHDTQKVGTFTSSMYETVYTAGDCSKCPKASLCDYRARCGDFNPKCSS